MPELPEVETMVRGVRPFVEGCQIADVVLPPCSRKPIAMTPGFQIIRERVMGCRLTKVWRRAKRIVLELSSGDSFLIEPRMTGLMLVADPPSTEHLRFEWQFNGSSHRLWFWDRRGLGTVALVNVAERAHVFAPLGPDALEVTLEEFSERFTKTGRAIKVSLLDQQLVAGIGNLYASEILHLSGIHPETSACRLTRVHFARLHASIRHVLEEAIRYEGSTLADGTYRNVLNQDGGYQNEHRVYDRADEPCPTCGQAVITRIVQAQRSTYFCKRCQKKR